MDTENQVVPESTTQNSSVGSKKCNHVPIIVVLAILAVCGFSFGGFELYQNINNGSQACNIKCEQGDNEGIVESDDTVPRTMITGSATFTVPNPPYGEGTDDGTVKFEYGVYNGVLSTYSISYRSNPNGYIVSEVVSDNVDLNTGKKLDNTTTLGRFGFTIDEVYRQILNNLVETVSVDSFLLDINGKIDAEKITINDFKSNIDKYIETLKSDQNLFYVFLKGSKVAVSYEQNKVLENLGMSSHMGVGLVSGYAEVEL